MRDETLITTLYHRLLDAWNSQDAAGYAACFTADANVVGFDGGMMNGRDEIHTTIHAIFSDHQTARYVPKVREVRFLSPEIALLRAVVGMVPPGGNDINAAANAIQSLAAVKQGDSWLIALFQNTPAQFHGKPEMVEALTEELRALL